ncbi:MAG: hypothetical protein ACPGUX_01245 [Halocynthiibacter sp.]
MRIGFLFAAVFAGVVTVSAAPLFALSCMPADVASNFQAADAADDTYVIVLGRATVQEQPWELGREAEGQHDFEYKSYIAQFEGQVAGRRGFRTAFNEEIEFRQSCRLWPNIDVCDDIGTRTAEQDSEDMIYFLRKTDDGYDFTTGDCPGGSYPATRSNVRQVRACMSGGACKAGWQ